MSIENFRWIKAKAGVKKPWQFCLAGESGSPLLELLLEPDSEQIIRAQQVLKNDNIYSGPIDGGMSQSVHFAIRSFQQSHQLNMTGAIDDETARELGLQKG